MSNQSAYLEPYVTSTNLQAQAITLPIFSLLGIAIVIIPFVWHYRNKNLAACTVFTWLILANIFTFVNAIIWPNEDFANWWDGTGLCDIEAKLSWPIFTGIPCAFVCITRNLANALRIDRATLHTTKKQRQRKLLVDCLILFLVPFLQVALHYCIQPDRYIIVAIGGCTPSFDSSWPTIVLMYIWPQIFDLAACYYCVVIIVRLRRYRAQFAEILEASNSNLTTSRFLRLFLMSFSFMVMYTPMSLYFFYVNVDIAWYPYSWSFVHDPSTWNTPLYLPFLGIRTLDRWLLILLTFSMFFFFGMGSDSIGIYREWLTKLGFARIWPSLALPRSRQNSTSSSTSWTTRLSLISKAKKYFDSRSSRKGSQSEFSASTTSNNSRSRSDSTAFSLMNQKSSFSTTATENPHLTGTTSFTSTCPQYQGPTNTNNRLPVVTEHPSCKLPDFNNPFAQPDPEAQIPSFPGISGTATSRHVTGGMFGSHQGSSFHVGLPSMKFSPMNLFPSIGWKRWSRATTTTTTTTSPMPEMNQSPIFVAKTPFILSKAGESAKFDLNLTSQYHGDVVPSSNPDWTPSPQFKAINPLHSNPSSSSTTKNLPTNRSPNQHLRIPFPLT